MDNPKESRAANMKIREDRNDDTKQKPRKIVADAVFYRGLRHDSILNTLI